MNDRAKIVFAALAAVLLAVVVAVVVLTGDGEQPPATVVTKEGNLEPPGEVLAAGEPASVVMETSEGSFTIELETTQSPKTANNFAYLTEEGFYDGLGFHRIVPDFVIQGGDPRGDGTGDPGYKVVEAPPRGTKYEPGVVAMAKSGTEKSGTSGSQFFVVTGQGGASLTPDYAVVGTVSEGFDVVQAIGQLGGADEQPTRAVVIEKATLEKG
jgi:cyclophilin family peptidyl-prolyl cis-trans isomerase